MSAWLRARYGAAPLHLLATLASLALAGAAVVRWFDSGSEVIRILAWLLAAIVGHDLVLLPLYSLLDRVTVGRTRAAGGGGGASYVRIPALLSGLLLIVFLPGIARLGSNTFREASGLNQHVYLGRWLAASGALFALSGAVYVVRRRAAAPRRARPSPPRSPRPR